MEPFDSIEKLINEHGSAAILREHLALLKAQSEAKDAKIKDLTFEKEELKRLNEEKDIRINNLANQKPADLCPYCRRTTGQLLRIGDHPNHELAAVGMKSGFYKCSDCGKEYNHKMAYP